MGGLTVDFSKSGLDRVNTGTKMIFGGITYGRLGVERHRIMFIFAPGELLIKPKRDNAFAGGAVVPPGGTSVGIHIAGTRTIGCGWRRAGGRYGRARARARE